MSGLSIAYIIWLAFTAMVISAGMGIGAWKISRKRASLEGTSSNSHFPPLEIVVPVTGQFPNQELILSTLLEQTYPGYGLIFVVESENDSANEVVDRLCTSHSQGRKVISGVASQGAQKNYNLIAGVRHLKPETEIIVFCDSTNAADPGWLERFSLPLRNSQAQVVSTFRTFRANPQTTGGVSQMMYGAFLRILATIKPKPWGGATAIRRDLFQRLHVVDAWANTVVDDLVLGNLLDEAGVPVQMDPFNLLTSPLARQTVSGFLQYLDRQIIFPKFTNPGMWLTTVLGVTNFGAALVASFCGVVLFALGKVSVAAGLASLAFPTWLAGCLWSVHAVDRTPVPLKKWLYTFVPFISCGVFLCVRSVFHNYVDWHGRRYYTGKKGVVLRISRVP
jgi:glycosyltransferase involved in cell wall biosynthesis